MPLVKKQALFCALANKACCQVNLSCYNEVFNAVDMGEAQRVSEGLDQKNTSLAQVGCLRIGKVLGYGKGGL